MDNSQVFVVSADSGISSFADLAGKIVEVQADSSAEAALKDNEELTGSFGTLQTTPDYNTAFMDLEMGAVDAIAMDVIVAGYQIEQRDDGESYVVLEETLASEEYGIGFKKGNEELRDKVHENTAYFREKVSALGFDVLEGNHPIVAVMLYDAKVAGEFASRMLEKGVYVVGFSYPVVPQGKARIRTQVSAGHTKEDLDFAVQCFKEVKAEMGI